MKRGGFFVFWRGFFLQLNKTAKKGLFTPFNPKQPKLKQETNGQAKISKKKGREES